MIRINIVEAMKVATVVSCASGKGTVRREGTSDLKQPL